MDKKIEILALITGIVVNLLEILVYCLIAKYINQVIGLTWFEFVPIIIILKMEQIAHSIKRRAL